MSRRVTVFTLPISSGHELVETRQSKKTFDFHHCFSREDSMPFVLFVLQIFGLESILGSDNLWPLLLALTILPAILQSIMLPFCPESPRYLLIVLNQEEEARKGGCTHRFTTEQT